MLVLSRPLRRAVCAHRRARGRREGQMERKSEDGDGDGDGGVGGFWQGV